MEVISGTNRLEVDAAIVGMDMSHTAQVTPNGFLMVEGIEEWITGLLPMGESVEHECFLYFEDSKTGAQYLIRRVK